MVIICLDATIISACRIHDFKRCFKILTNFIYNTLKFRFLCNFLLFIEFEFFK